MRRRLASRRRVREVLTSFRVERLRSHVDAIGPCNRPPVGIDPDEGEVGGIAQRLEDTAPVAPAEVDVAHRAVLEAQTQLELANNLDSDDVHELLHAQMLRQRINRLERLLTASSLPIGDQLILMQSRPLRHKCQRAPRQRPRDHLACEIDRRGFTRIASVEMRPRVCAFVPLHPDRDPVEETDPRHSRTLRPRPKASANGSPERDSPANGRDPGARLEAKELSAVVRFPFGLQSATQPSYGVRPDIAPASSMAGIAGPGPP